MSKPTKSWSRRQWMGVALAAALPLPGVGLAQKTNKPAKPDAGALLNLAFRQPMLAERITKSFTQAGQKVLPARSARQLDDARLQFAAALRELRTHAPNAEIKENYDLLEQLFDEFKGITAKPVNLENAAHLAEQNEELVWISTKGAQLMQAHFKSARADLIATAGDVRTLSQRIAKLYLFRSWGIRSDVIAKDLKAADEGYRTDMAKLLAAAQSTPAIKMELALAETQYIFLKQAIERLNRNQTSVVELEHVAKTCDNILEVMERVARQFEGTKA